MSSTTDLLLTFTKLARPINKGIGILNIIIKQPYAGLENEMRSVFEKEENVNIFVDRRNSERRLDKKPAPFERRVSDRRRPKEVMVEASITL
ncbi:MAG: hypothetical protein JW932_05855 [Deltaproteobacteria bacterium]|nr:hypothetical protein [Deltaproteobacteria bacterium]